MPDQNTAPTAVDLAKEVLGCARAVEKAKLADAEADLKIALAEAAKGIETACQTQQRPDCHGRNPPGTNMKKALKIDKPECKVWHYKDGEKVFGLPPGLRGDVDGLRGDVDDCELTSEDRAGGIDIRNLIS